MFIFDCWRRCGTTSGAIHTAMPWTIVVTSSMYIIMSSSYEYENGVVGIFSFRLVLYIETTRCIYEDRPRPCPYHIYATFYFQGMSGGHDGSLVFGVFVKLKSLPVRLIAADRTRGPAMTYRSGHTSVDTPSRLDKISK